MNKMGHRQSRQKVYHDQDYLYIPTTRNLSIHQELYIKKRGRFVEYDERIHKSRNGFYLRYSRHIT
jgi:hypothetical protein